MCKTIKVTATDTIECDNCGEKIPPGHEVLIDIHLIEGTYFFCGEDCMAAEHGEPLTEEQERRQELLEETGIAKGIDEFTKLWS